MNDTVSSRMRKSHHLSAVSASFLQHQSFLKKFLSRYLYNHQDIEDVAQETYLRAFNAEKKQIVSSPKAFLFRIAKNLALSELAKKSRQITDHIEGSVSPNVIYEEKSPEGQAQDREKLTTFIRSCHMMPVQCRKAFLLRKVYGFSHKEIAEQMGISVSTVEKHVASGLLRSSRFLIDRGHALENVSQLDNERRKQIKRNEKSGKGHIIASGTCD